MALNDEQEKRRQAEEWLREADMDGQYFQAAWEYIMWKEEV